MENLENDFKMQLYNKESQIIELQSKLDSLSGINKNFTTPEIKRVFINDSSRGKQNINYNNSDLVNNGQHQKKAKNLNYDYLSQFEKSKTINILNNNISIEHQLKIQCEKFAEKLDEIENQRLLLVSEIVS